MIASVAPAARCSSEQSTCWPELGPQSYAPAVTIDDQPRRHEVGQVNAVRVRDARVVDAKRERLRRPPATAVFGAVNVLVTDRWTSSAMCTESVDCVSAASSDEV